MKKIILGLKKGEIRLINYQIEWEQIFIKEKEKIKKVLNNYYEDIEHFGSTSIKGIKAKPIIDIIIALPNFDNINIIINSMESIGYIFKDQKIIPNDYYFTKGKPTKFHVHIVKKNSINWQLNITFRNKLRENYKLAKEYEALKLNLSKVSENRLDYMYGKTDFIYRVAEMENILKK